jgi:oligopeptide/dipeptide ABC transporter ATP-binding protein
MTATTPLLRVTDLRTHYHTREGVVRAVDGVSFDVDKGTVFALVGESGCGKSQTALSIMRLIQCPPGRIESGRVELDGSNLLELPESKMRQVRGSRISMVFQEPMTSLNPVFTCGSQIVETIQLHRPLGAGAAARLAVDLLAKVGIPDPSLRFREYPHQLSGGMQQRVMIALALSCNPSLLIADEPTTALDVTIQAQILGLLRQLQQRESLGILFITHDLGVVAEIADSVAVMYASQIVERAGVRSLFRNPAHPYTEGLFRSVPRLGQTRHRLHTIPGGVPNPLSLPSGCRFHPRCQLTRHCACGGGRDTVEIAEGAVRQRVLRRCVEEEPQLREIAEGHWCSCWEKNGVNGSGSPESTNGAVAAAVKE